MSDPKHHWPVMGMLLFLILGIRLYNLDADFPHEHLEATPGSAVEEGTKTQSARLARAATAPASSPPGVSTSPSPLTDFLYGLAFQIFGPGIESPRIVSALMFFLLAIVFIWATRDYPSWLVIVGLTSLGCQQILLFYTRIATHVAIASVLFFTTLLAMRRIHHSERLVRRRFEFSCSAIFVLSLLTTLGLGAHHLVLPLFLFFGLIIAELSTLRSKIVEYPVRLLFLGVSTLPIVMLLYAGISLSSSSRSTLQMVKSWILHPLTESSPFLVASGLLCAAFIVLIHPGHFVQNNIYRAALLVLLAVGPISVALFQDQLRYFVPLLPAYPLVVLEWISGRGWNIPTPGGGRESWLRKALSYYFLLLAGFASIKGINEWFLHGLQLPVPADEKPGLSNENLLVIGALLVPGVLFLYSQRQRAAKISVRVLVLHARAIERTIELNLRNTAPLILLALLGLSLLQDFAVIFTYFLAPPRASREVTEQLIQGFENRNEQMDELLVLGDWAPYLLMGTTGGTLWVHPERLEEYVQSWNTGNTRPTHFLRTQREHDPGLSSPRSLDVDQAIFEALEEADTIHLGEPIPLGILWNRELRLYPLTFEIPHEQQASPAKVTLEDHTEGHSPPGSSS